MTLGGARASLRGWMRRVWGALTGRRTDRDLARELAAHLAHAEDALRQQGHTPQDAARLARAAAGGEVQALEVLREQRGLPWLWSSWLDVKLGARLLVRNWGLTLVGGVATTVAIGIAAVVFAGFELVAGTSLPLDEGDRVVAIQVWDRAATARRDATWQDLERWQADLVSVDEVGAFQAARRNVAITDGAIELAQVAEMSPAGFSVARVPALLGRVLTEADALPAAPPAVVIGHEIWQRRFFGTSDVIGRELRIGGDVHTIVGVMPEHFAFPFNFQYWVPLRRAEDGRVRDTGPEGVIFGRLASGASIESAQVEVSALGLYPTRVERPNAGQTSPRVVPYTFAFTGDFERGQLGMMWSVASLALVLLLLPPCANIAILNYARTVTRQQEFAARHALGGSRGRIVWQLFLESLVLTTASAAAALVVVRVVSVIVGERLQSMPGGPPFWMTFGVSAKTMAFVAALALVAAAIAGLVPALQATRRLARLGAGALAGRTSLGLGATWTSLVIVQVALSVAALPLAAELAWGTLRSGIIGPGFAAEAFATARIAPGAATGIDAARFGARQRELTERLRSDPGIAGVASALEPPGEEPWVFIDAEAGDAGEGGTHVLARFNRVEPAFFDLYGVPRLAGRALDESDAAPSSESVVVNRNFAESLAPGGNALGRRFRYARTVDESAADAIDRERWYTVVGVVGNLPATTEARVAYHATAPGSMRPARLQLRLEAGASNIESRLRQVVATVDPTLQVDEVRRLSDIYRDHRFGDNLGASAIGAVTASVLLLSAAGLYALMAFTVAARRREIGIRAALGASPRSLLAAVFRRAAWQIGAGSCAGLLAAFLIGRYVPIEEVGGRSIPGILPGAAAFLLLVGALAALGPARKGLRIDPTEALRNQ
jgi:predicted permease